MANYDGLSRNAWPGTWSTNGTHPIILDTEQRGGLRLVTGSGTDTLVNIPSGMLQDGMLAYVGSGYHADVSGEKYYKYSVLEGESRDTSTGFLPNASGNWSEFTTGGSSTRSYQNISGTDVSMTSSDDVIFANCTSSDVNVYIPTAVNNGGKEILVKRTGGNNSLVIHASGSETIDGQSTITMQHNFQATTLISNNSNWFIY